MTPNGQATEPINKDAITAKSKAVVANLLKLDPQNPLPFDFSSDSYRVVYGKRYLPFLGYNDNLPNIFWEARALSTTHNACISTIAHTCVGEGVYVTNVDPKDVDPDFLTWISRINNDGQSLSELVRLAIDGRDTDGNGWIEIVKGKVGSEKYLKVYFNSSLYCRLTSPDPKTGEITTAVKSLYLAHYRNGMLTQRSLKAVEFPLYSPEKSLQSKVWQDVNKDGDLHTMIHLKNEVGSVLYYGLPPSHASLRYQVLEGKAAQYNIDNFENNMVMSGLLIFKSGMTEDEAAKVARTIIQSHTGQGKNGRVGVISSESGIDDFTWQPLQTEKEGSFIQLDDKVVGKIITSHGWDGLLAGIPDKGGALGKGSTYVRAIFDVKKAMVLKPREMYIKQKLLMPLLAIAAEWYGKPAWLDYDLGLKMMPPYSLISDIQVNNVLTKNEGRAILGFGPMKNIVHGEEIIGTRITETETFSSPTPIL